MIEHDAEMLQGTAHINDSRLQRGGLGNTREKKTFEEIGQREDK